MVVDARYMYIRDHKWPSEAVDVHHIIIPKISSSKCFVIYTSIFVLLANASYVFLVNEKTVTFSSLGFLWGALLIIILRWNTVIKESVVVLPAFGVQLEAHYASGRVARRFVPVSKILKPVLIESLDLICKDKDEAEVWFMALKALISHSAYHKWNTDTRSNSPSSGSGHPHTQRTSPSTVYSDRGDNQQKLVPFENLPPNGLAKAFSDIVSYTAAPKNQTQDEVSDSLNTILSVGVENTNGRNSATETCRVSLSSMVSSSSYGSCQEDFDALGDVFIWGEGIGHGILGGGTQRVGSSSSTNTDMPLPKALESTVVLDVNNIACGSRHAVLVTKQGETFSWGEESGGRLGHGLDADVSHPKLINILSGMSVELLACGEYHMCAVTLSRDLYSWGDGTHCSGLLGNESGVSHWIPRKVSGNLEGMRVSYVSCGPWHTAVVTSSGQLFTFGDGSFGALGHGDRSSMSIPREVDRLRGLRTLRVACGAWHTAAVVEIIIDSSGQSRGSLSGKLFTWGTGDKGQLGHGGYESRLAPECVAAMVDENLGQVACGHSLTVSLSTAGKVYAMGSPVHGQLGNPGADGKLPACVGGKLEDSFVEETACGSYHVAALTLKSDVYTWGKGTNGQLGHGDNEDWPSPTLVDFFKEKQVRSVVGGLNFSASIWLHKWISLADHSACSGCHNLFRFRRKRHNCYNCGLVFCKACSSKKSLKAALAPNMNKPYRVCDDCFTKLKKAMELGPVARIPRVGSRNILLRSNEVVEKEVFRPVSQEQISRTFSVDSLNRVGNRHEGSDRLSDSRLFLTRNGNFKWGGYCSFKSSTSLEGHSKKVASSSVPDSTRVEMRLTSPTSERSSPFQSATLSPSFNISTSPEPVAGVPNQTNDRQSQEIISLRAQVEDLTRKTEYLETEGRQLKEATTLAAGEAERCKSAKDVISSLAMEAMSEKDQEGQISSRKSTSSSASKPYPATSTKPSSGGAANSTSSNGTSAQTEKMEWVAHAEPGVYITVSSLPGGGNGLNRVRFSRKRFNEGEAEKWWAENSSKVYERHNIRSAE